MNKEEIQKLAIAEVLHPTFELTKQYLATNKLVYKGDIPVIEDIILGEENEVALVYFPVEGERYYFVIGVDLKPQPSVRGMNMSAGNTVSFCATSVEHTTEELLAVAGIEPTRQWKIWEKGKIPRHNGFEVQLDPKEIGEVEDKLTSLINLLLPYKENLQKLATIADTYISIPYWGYKDQMWGLLFDRKTIQGLAELNLEVSIDLYASGPDLADE